MQEQLFIPRAAPSTPAVIVQLFALEDGGRQGGSLSNQALAPVGRRVGVGLPQVGPLRGLGRGAYGRR